MQWWLWWALTPQRQRSGVHCQRVSSLARSRRRLDALHRARWPWENGFAESFHSRFRDECLAQEIFDGLHDARAITAAWKDDYNYRRPHGSLGFQTPAGFAAACAASASAKASAPAAHAAICPGQTQP